MNYLLYTILFLSLIGILIQDFKYRAIHWAIVFTTFMASLGICYVKTGTLTTAAPTMLFIIIVLLLLWLYITIKHKGYVNMFSQYLGLGDVLFFLAIAPLFTVKMYGLFFVTGMLVTILFHSIYNKKKENSLIPLAGILSGYLITLKTIDFFTNSSFLFI